MGNKESVGNSLGRNPEDRQGGGGRGDGSAGPIDEQLLAEYRLRPNNPEAITRICRAFLPEVNIPECDWTEEEIVTPIIGLRGIIQPGIMIYLPEMYNDASGLIRLGTRFPALTCTATEVGGSVISEHRPSGWYQIEAISEPPNPSSTEEALRGHFKHQNRDGQTLQAYVLGSQFSKLVFGRYFDDDYSASRLLGSRIASWVVDGRFHNNGSLHVMIGQKPQDVRINLGGRSMSKLKAA